MTMSGTSTSGFGGGRAPAVSKPPNVPFLDLGAMNDEVADEVEVAWKSITASGQFIGGPYVAEFERAWADYCGTTYAVGLANGTDALHLALRAAGVGVGDEVVLPANTFAATAEAVVLAGARPRFADVDPATLLLTPRAVQAALTPTTAAVIAVHLYGQMADMDGLSELTNREGLLLVEDAAQAQGALWRSRKAGSIGHVGCFSFYPGKNLGAYGDAGAVVTSDPDLARKIASMRDHGRRARTHYDHEFVGTNSRLDAVQAAVLVAKLRRLDRWNDARRALMAAYRVALDGGPVRLVAEGDTGSPVHHLAVARVTDRDGVRERLLERGIQTGIHYPIPCHKLQPYQMFADRPLVEVETAAAEVLSLPMFPHMTQVQVLEVCTALQAAVGSAPGSHGG